MTIKYGAHLPTCEHRPPDAFISASSIWCDYPSCVEAWGSTQPDLNAEQLVDDHKQTWLASECVDICYCDYWLPVDRNIELCGWMSAEGVHLCPYHHHRLCKEDEMRKAAGSL